MNGENASGGVVGIDLGTTNSSVARPGEGTDLIEIEGERLCPSVVGFEEGTGFVAGRAALHRAVFDPEGTIRSVKRAMGSDCVYYLGGHELTPEEVSARILSHVASAAQKATGQRPEKAVITIPAYFGQASRQATRRAGELAGLEVLRLLHEPTAAALAHRPDGPTRQMLVYDLGGGTFDVSLVRQEGALLEVVSSHGDTKLGGDDFDLRLAERILYLHAGGDEVAAEAIRRSPTSWVRILLEAEAVKKRLSTEVETIARVEFIEGADGRVDHLEVPVSRSLFESVVSDLLRRTIASIESVLADARVTVEDVDEILLVGGSTRMPAVWHLLQDVYRKEPTRSPRPDEAVALGAGIEAGMIGGIQTGRVLVDVCPFSIGTAALLEDGNGSHMVCRTITPRNSPIPSRHVERFLAVTPDQERVRAFFFQGGDVDPLKNQLIGVAELSGIRRRGTEAVPTIHIALDYNLDGVIEVQLVDGSGKARTASRFRPDAPSPAGLLEEYVAHCRQADVLPGPAPEAGGGSPAAEGAIGQLPVPAGPPTAAFTERLGDLRDDVETIARRLAELSNRHPDRADELGQAVTTARRALTEPIGDLDAAIEAHARLADLVFDLGEFL